MIKAFFLIRRDLEVSQIGLACIVGDGVDEIHFGSDDNPFFHRWCEDGKGKVIMQVNGPEHLDCIRRVIQECGIRYSDIMSRVRDDEQSIGIVVHPTDEQYIPKKIKRLREWV